MAHLGDDSNHKACPDPVYADRVFRVASEIFNLDIELVDEFMVEVHFEIIL